MMNIKNVMTRTYVKATQFLNDQKGEGGAVNWVVMVFVGVVLAIGVYALFKDQINTFVTDNIFGRMDQLR